jgi:hypothetical protein
MLHGSVQEGADFRNHPLGFVFEEEMVRVGQLD